jgi:aryl-alcohol dehydrogenase-like predicted oxidoreductase
MRPAEVEEAVRARHTLLLEAEARGMGIIAKRPIANAAWGAASSPSGYADEYWRRAQAMQAEGRLPLAPDDRISLALAFTLAHDEVDVAIIGTKNPEHMLGNIRRGEGACAGDAQRYRSL